MYIETLQKEMNILNGHKSVPHKYCCLVISDEFYAR